MTTERIKDAIGESIAAKEALTEDDHALILEMAYTMVEALSQGNKIIWIYLERDGMPSIALHCNTSVVTAIGNDYGFERIFERQVEALARAGDVVVGISTSGNSPNVLRAIERARNVGCLTIGLTGASGGQLERAVDLCLKVPSEDTPRIQEVHITVGHIICEIVESVMFG
jgi:D-sedoheptulose 7-phosphate isomerase